MYYGGFLSWENIGEFTRHLGCDKIYSGVDMGGKSDSGQWGVEDEKLFNLVLEKTNPEEYSLNVIMTSSYHAPYVVNVEEKGFPYKSPDDFPAEVKSYFQNGMNMKELGHLWYGDYAIGEFVKGAEQKFDKTSLFAFTGDHYGRRFVNKKPNLVERSCVPFILYGEGIEKGIVSNTPGSHSDIIPTLIETVAPEGFTYYSFGQSMFTPDKQIGIGFEKVITGDSLFYFPKDAKVDVIDLSNLKELQLEENPYSSKYNDFMALAWHYIRFGDKLAIDKKEDKKK